MYLAARDKANIDFKKGFRLNTDSDICITMYVFFFFFWKNQNQKSKKYQKKIRS